MFQTTETTVIKIALREMPARGGEARREAARLWNRMVKLHRWFRCRQLPWPTEAPFKTHFKGRFRLHSQTMQGIVEKFFSSIKTTSTNRRNGDKRARYPWRTKHYIATPWKGQSLRLKGRHLTLAMGRGRSPLRVKLAKALALGHIVTAELGFHELRLTMKRPVALKPAGSGVAAMDSGVIHLGVVTDGSETLAVVGRGLRSIVQGHPCRKTLPMPKGFPALAHAQAQPKPLRPSAGPSAAQSPAPGGQRRGRVLR